MAIEAIGEYPGDHVFVSYVIKAYKDKHSSLDPGSVHFEELEDKGLGLERYPDFIDIFEAIINSMEYDSVCLQGTWRDSRIPAIDDYAITTRDAWLMREKGLLLRMIKGSALEDAFRERWPLSWMLGGYILRSSSAYLWDGNGGVNVESGFNLYTYNGVLLLRSEFEYAHETAKADPGSGETQDRVQKKRLTSLEVEDGLARAVFEAIRYNSTLPYW